MRLVGGTSLALQYGHRKSVDLDFFGILDCEVEELEDDIDGYSFRLPKDSYQLCEIGTALHNCVASYGERVAKEECTIVYAQKNGEYKICIEVRGKEIVQERIDRNERPGS